MVVFTCNNCGESLQKPKVEKHYAFACRAEKNLTCVDCFKDFRGEEYVPHTKCFTEDERYAAKGTYANGIVKKGEAKQESWVEMVTSILDTDNTLNPPCRKILDTISSYNNIPRKKLRFMNFIKSSFGGRANMKDVEDVWNVIEKYKNETKKAQNNGNVRKAKEDGQNDSNGISEQKNTKNEENETKKRKNVEVTEDSPKKKKHKKDRQTEKTNVENTDLNIQEEKTTVNIQDNDDQKKKKKHKKQEQEILDATNEALEENVTFNFQEKILEIVSAKQSISLKKLQKKVLNAYIKATGETEVTPKAIKKFNKKLKKIPNLEIGEEKVTISET